MRNGEGSALQDGSKDADPLRYDDSQASSQFVAYQRGNNTSEKATQIVYSDNGPDQRGRRISELRTKGFGIDNSGKDAIVVSKQEESGSRRSADCNSEGIPSNGAETHVDSMLEGIQRRGRYSLYTPVNEIIRLDSPTGNCRPRLQLLKDRMKSAGKWRYQPYGVMRTFLWVLPHQHLHQTPHQHQQRPYSRSPAARCNFRYFAGYGANPDSPRLHFLSKGHLPQICIIFFHSYQRW